MHLNLAQVRVLKDMPPTERPNKHTEGAACIHIPVDLLCNGRSENVRSGRVTEDMAPRGQVPLPRGPIRLSYLSS